VPELNEICAQLEAASDRARRIVAGMSRGHLDRRPDAGSWLVAECLRHLTLTTDAFLPPIRAALEEGLRKKLAHSGGRFRMGATARMLAWWLEPPYRMRSKASPPFVPDVEDPARVLPEFLDRQEKLLSAVADADGLALDRLSIPSPFAARLRYNVYAAFVLIAVHERRHLWQAEQVVRRLGGI
jgi:hypothetical protein